MLGKRRLATLGAIAAATVTWFALFAPSSSVSAAVAPGTTERASVADANTEGALDSQHAQISANGRFVVFSSFNNLNSALPANASLHDFYAPLPGQAQTQDIYLRDRVAKKTYQVSVGMREIGESGRYQPINRVTADDDQNPDGPSDYPTISATGRYVAFTTNATNISGTNQARHVVVCDLDDDSQPNNGIFLQPTDGVPDFSCFDAGNFDPKLRARRLAQHLRRRHPAGVGYATSTTKARAPTGSRTATSRRTAPTELLCRPTSDAPAALSCRRFIGEGRRSDRIDATQPKIVLSGGIVAARAITQRPITGQLPTQMIVEYSIDRPDVAPSRVDFATTPDTFAGDGQVVQVSHPAPSAQRARDRVRGPTGPAARDRRSTSSTTPTTRTSRRPSFLAA